jgi:hypothetical protein
LEKLAFARRIGVPVDTVRNWEQGKRAPQGPARALLRIINGAPEAALHALDRSQPGPAASMDPGAPTPLPATTSIATFSCRPTQARMPTVAWTSRRTP